jgi:septal ring factor EnvC (AmiA/AmiB activator)
MMIGGRLRFGVLAGALGLAISLGPGSLVASPAPAEEVASFGLESELSRLDEVRERLGRRRALEAMLSRRLGSLSREVDALRAGLEQTWAQLQEERAEARALEWRLDRLVPRLLARSAAVRERRERAARLLADFANSGRQAQLDPTIRARLLAISPLMLQRLQGAESGLAVIERQPDQLIARHREIERRTPLLMAEGQLLQRQREQTERQRQAVVAQLEQVRAEARALGGEQQRLARKVLNSEAAQVARASPQADQPALPNSRSAGAGALDAAVRGQLAEGPRSAFAVQAVQRAASRLAAAVPEALAAAPPDAAAYAAFPALTPPPATPLDAALKGELGPSLASAADQMAAPLHVVFLQPDSLAEVPSTVLPARLRSDDLAGLQDDGFARLAPIMPVPGEVANPFSDQGSAETGPGIRIVAAPGQAVAAPEDGRVVFAAPFKSYGLLLIIEHQREYHTLLWGLSTLEVEVGDQVRTGQIVGVMATDVASPPELHVEVRRNGRPVNPLPWLAASSNKVRG